MMMIAIFIHLYIMAVFLATNILNFAQMANLYFSR